MVSRGILLAVVLGLLGCGRRPAQQETKATFPQPPPTLTAAAAPSSPSPVIPPDEATRPSPFPEPVPVSRPETTAPKETKAPKPALSDRSGTNPASKPYRAFVPPAAPKPVTSDLLLPSPPALSSSAPASSNLTLGRAPCCTATATYEVSKPGKLQRAFGKVPGFRHVAHASPAEAAFADGYVPPRPAGNIVFVLPPGASPAAMEQRRMDLKATINAEGAVTRVELLAPKDQELVNLASYAASEWRFIPARHNDTAVPSEVILHFNFEGH
jgi:hypothetical protein